jgi:3-oxoacyl-[acyl-carrier protein] reductase
MDLHIQDKFFIVGGASSGFGKAIAQSLLNEGASVLMIARSEDKLKEAAKGFKKAEILVGDITTEFTLNELYKNYGNREWHGLLLNAGGPPAKPFLETNVEDWDIAYHSLLRWKMQLLKYASLKMMTQNYGRLLIIESSTLKRPLQNLVLSNSLRMAVAAMAKTLSRDIAPNGVTLNIIAPGYHKTGAVDRIFARESKELGISVDEVKNQIESQIPTGEMGNPEDFASLATWLLSPVSRYVTGQVYTVDGGFVNYPL